MDKKLQQYAPEEDFVFETIKGGSEVKIVGYKDNNTEVRFPPTLLNLPVTIIGKRAFAYNNIG